MGGLGGIIPTANLFSRFLEKNVEQAVDVFGFHTNPYAHLLNAGWEHRRYNPIEEASSNGASSLGAYAFFNSYEGRRANRSYAQTFEYINSLESGFEIFYDLNFIPPKVNVGESFSEVHLTFNGKVIDIEDRQIWDTGAVV